MKFYVYIIQNLLNDKIYIGKTNDPQIRWRNHLAYASGGKEKYPTHFQYIHASISSHGKNNFYFDTIEEFESETEALDAEQFWIEFFRSWDKNFGYNLTFGGEGSSGRITTEDTKNKIREKATGRLHSEETKIKISIAGRLRTNSEETRKKISLSNKGRKQTEEQILNNSKRQRGELSPRAKLTNEQANKIRDLLKTHSIKKLSILYNVSVSTISHIKNNRTYK